MIKHLFLTPFIVLCSLAAQAQFRYIFKDTATAYAPLSGASSLNGSLIWDEGILSVTMPFIWKMDNTISVNDFNLVLTFPGFIADTTDPTDFNGFMFGDIDIADRGLLSGTSSRSPIRYITTGITPNRIFKLELFNAGFYDEYQNYRSMDDSFNLQIWVYEIKNIVELHFGPSRITHASDYWGYTLDASGLF